MLSAFLGLFFIIFGNYLPKVSPNHVVGIRLPWTLKNTENWRKTHRFAGWIFFISGIVLLLTSYWEMYWTVISVTIIVILIPTCYSYLLSKKGY
ncbi:SdpI family protein [Lactobacillus juensis]|uniref:SdpI family protein n=1 Tax=Lactobacillus juensis TaxID=3082862 RepID=UPI0030C66059